MAEPAEPRTAYSSKIQAAAERRQVRASPGLGSFGDLGPGAETVAEWQALGLRLPDMPAIRRYRLERVRAELRSRDYAGILLYDPLNIRYATDSANMQLWCAHNPVRYAFVATEGPVVLFDYHNCEFLSDYLPEVDEMRGATSWFYMGSGPRTEERAQVWAEEVLDLVRTHGGGNRRLAVDKLDVLGAGALKAGQLTLTDGQEIMELARAVKSDEEIVAMRCALAATQAGMVSMWQALRPGITEQALWAELHRANIARGGEWIETRLLSSGPRTNPWMQECSSRAIEAGDLVGFDTDLIGPYGYCIDISRTWLCGGDVPSGEQKSLMAMAQEQVAFNVALLKPGLGFRELTERSFALPEIYRPQRYSVVVHGVGLCDEYPSVKYPEDFAASGYDGVFEAGMVICVESYVGAVGGREGVKLEEQVLITETGAEVLSTFPTGLIPG